jgi:hypothetical protein
MRRGKYLPSREIPVSANLCALFRRSWCRRAIGDDGADNIPPQSSTRHSKAACGAENKKPSLTSRSPALKPSLIPRSPAPRSPGRPTGGGVDDLTHYAKSASTSCLHAFDPECLMRSASKIKLTRATTFEKMEKFPERRKSYPSEILRPEYQSTCQGHPGGNTVFRRANERQSLRPTTPFCRHRCWRE